MRCSCCDKVLSDAEATAKFVEADGSKPYRFVEMCTKCQGFLPKEVKIVTRPDLSNTIDDDEPYTDELFDKEYYNGDEE